jgi:hypothetical protein
MKPNTYKIIQEAVENGVALGYNRAYKHSETPSEGFIKQQIYDAVMSEICEWFMFDSVE